MKWDNIPAYFGIIPSRHSTNQELWFSRSAFWYTNIGLAVAVAYSIFYAIIGADAASFCLGFLGIILIGTLPLHRLGKSRLLAHINLSATSLALAGVVLHTGGSSSSGACWLLGVTPGITALLFRQHREIITLTCLTLALYALVFYLEMNGFQVDQLGYERGSAFEKVYSFVHFFAFSVFIAMALSIFAITQMRLYGRLEANKEALASSHSKINAILSSISQAVFMIDADLNIHGERSSLTTALLGHDADSFHAFLLKSDLGSDKYATLVEAVRSMIGEDEMNYSANQHLLPPMLRQSNQDSSETKVFSLQWTPMFKQDVCQSLLLAIRDMTELEETRKKEQLILTRNQILMMLLRIPRHSIQMKVKEIIALSTRVTVMLHADSLSRSELFGVIHTLKGVSRTIGFYMLADQCHVFEEHLTDETRTSAQLQLDLKAIQDVIKNMDDIYQETFDTKLMHQSLRGREGLDDLTRFRLKWEAEAAQLAQDLQKPRPHFLLEGEFPALTEDWEMCMSAILGHLLRNSLDHGIESAEQRKSLGKAIHPIIRLRGTIHADRFVMYFEDDGRGLNLASIRSKIAAPPTEDLTAELLAEKIFEPAFSTRDQADMISGRGIGMTAVRDEIRRLGGDIRIEFQARERDGYRAFRFRLEQPLKVAA